LNYHILWFECGLSPKGSRAGSLVPSVAVLRSGGAFTKQIRGEVIPFLRCNSHEGINVILGRQCEFSQTGLGLIGVS
jgi:hypothetical protein